MPMSSARPRALGCLVRIHSVSWDAVRVLVFIAFKVEEDAGIVNRKFATNKLKLVVDTMRREVRYSIS